MRLAGLSPAPPPSVQLAAIKKVLQFCCQGELVGGALFQQLSPCLGTLFKKTYTLLKVCYVMSDSSQRSN